MKLMKLMNWNVDAMALTAALEAAGYDVDERDASLPEGGGSLTARRDRANGTVVVAVDAGGRFRATATRLLAESATFRDVAGVALRLQTRVSRATTAVGEVADAEQFAALLAVLDEVLGRVPLAEAEAESGAERDVRAEAGGPW